MSLISEFELAWKPFEDRIKSYIATNTAKNTVIDIEDLTSIYNQACRMWEDHSRVQAGFLAKWKKEAPELENEVIGTLRNFAFIEPEGRTKKFPVAYVSAATGITIVGGVIGWLIPKTNFLKAHLGNIPVIIIGAALFAVVGGGIIKGLYDNSINKNCKDVADKYYKQLDALHLKLQEICKRYS